MPFAQESGYTPTPISSIMSQLMANINTQFGTSYDSDSFAATNLYKYFYALAQKMQENEVATSEIFSKMEQYFSITNEKIQRPNTSHPGIFDYFEAAGYLVSTKPPLDADAGKLFVCVDVDETADDYAATKLALCNLVKLCCVAGVISQGTESEDITLDNGQEFTFKYNLPTRIPVELRLTVTQSENNLFKIDDVTVVAQRLYDNIVATYKLGKNFEPQRYFSVANAPWAQSVLLEWSDDAGSTWYSTVFDADYDELFTFELADISIVEV